jgi:transposase
MPMLLGLDIHRQQITFDALDPETGEFERGRIQPVTRERLRAWLARYVGCELEVALEATTGWRFVAEELEAVGADVHLAEPAETAARRGPKRRAKTDRLDARHLRELLQAGRLPESWIPPAHILDLRSRVRLRKALMDERSGWQRRIHACLFHEGAPRVPELLSGEGRAALARVALPEAARERVEVALRMIGAIDRELAPLERELNAFARHQAGCRALMGDYGVGALTATAILAELGDARRFRSSRRAVRHSGLDITVYASDLYRSAGHLSRQGVPLLRWALYEAAKSASRRSSPDHDYYRRVAARIGRRRATLSVARKLLRRAYHTLVDLGEEALAPAA